MEQSKIQIEGATISIIPSRRKTVKKTQIDVYGSLTIRNIDEFYSSIRSTLTQYDLIDFNLKDITDLDLSYLQLFHHLKNATDLSSKQITIDATLDVDTTKLLSRTGLKYIITNPKTA